MTNPNRVAGKIYFSVDGVQHSAKGDYTYNLGKSKRTTIVGADGVHGYKEEPKTGFIEGVITDHKDLDLGELQELDGVTVTLELANGKTIVGSNAWYAHDGDVNTAEAEIPVRFEGDVEEDKGAST